MITRFRQAYLAAMAPAGKPRRKYGNKRVTVAGETFDSQAEGFDWLNLQARERMGEIVNLERQVGYEFVVNGVKVGRARFDFRWQTPTGRVVVADRKGYQNPKDPVTRLFNRNVALMKALFGIDVMVMK